MKTYGTPCTKVFMVFFSARVTRNIVRWLVDGITFFGVLVQGDTVYRAIKQNLELKEEQENSRQDFDPESYSPDYSYPYFARRSDKLGAEEEEEEEVDEKQKLKSKRWKAKRKFAKKRRPKMPYHRYGPRSFLSQ